jgi:hypothetical protein
MINISFASRPVDDPRGKANTIADQEKFASAIGAGAMPGSPTIAIAMKPKSGTAADPTAIRPQAVLHLPSPGPLVAGQRAQDNDDAAHASSTASGSPGVLVAPRNGEAQRSERGRHANPLLRTVFDVAIAQRRADLEVPSAVAGAMEAGRERLTREMSLGPAVSEIAPSSRTISPATSSDPSSSVNGDRVTSPMGPSTAATPRPTSSGSAPMTVSLSPAGASAQAFAVQAPRISTAEINIAMHSALAAAQQERPIAETREKDLVRAQQERPTDQIMKEDLEATKGKLVLPGGERDLLVQTLVEKDEEGLVDPEAEKILLERANAMLQEKYQMILDDYFTRIASREA